MLAQCKLLLVTLLRSIPLLLAMYIPKVIRAVLARTRTPPTAAHLSCNRETWPSSRLAENVQAPTLLLTVIFYDRSLFSLRC